MKLAVVITAHNEGVMLRSAVLSAIRAYAASRCLLKWSVGARYGLELIVVLDKACSATVSASDALQHDVQSVSFHNEVRLVIKHSDFGEPGSARNLGVSNALDSDLIAILDADDLLGQKYLVLAIKRFAGLYSDSPSRIPRLAIHPEFLFYFGEKCTIWRQPSSAEVVQYPDGLLRNNLWDVTVIAPRAVFDDVSFCASVVSRGEGYEDWEWVLSSSLMGIEHDIAPGTFCYKRTKPHSRFSSDNANSVLLSTTRLRQIMRYERSTSIVP
jgi:glycosyltransferase involved in cell wall biosynthesis